jgi:LAS superfamily LD-carboxypeptidase LdcB
LDARALAKLLERHSLEGLATCIGSGCPSYRQGREKRDKQVKTEGEEGRKMCTKRRKSDDVERPGVAAEQWHYRLCGPDVYFMCC